MNRFHGGIQINTRLLKKVEVNPDGNTAMVGGGVLQFELVRELYTQGKMGGMCVCVIYCILFQYQVGLMLIT